jgi:hypothetical protein
MRAMPLSTSPSSLTIGELETRTVRPSGVRLMLVVAPRERPTWQFSPESTTWLLARQPALDNAPEVGLRRNAAKAPLLAT